MLDASTGEALDAEVAMIDLETGQAISRTRSNREEGLSSLFQGWATTALRPVQRAMFLA